MKRGPRTKPWASLPLAQVENKPTEGVAAREVGVKPGTYGVLGVKREEHVKEELIVSQVCF